MSRRKTSALAAPRWAPWSSAHSPILRRPLNLPRPVTAALAWQAPFALAIARPRTRARDAGIYALQMWAYVASYEMPNDNPEQLMRRLRADYVPRSTARSGWARRPRSGCSVSWCCKVVRPHDTFLSAVHWSWFLVPHGTMLFVLLRHHDVFARNAVMMAATFDLGCVVYWLVPTAPPWWAGSVGKMPHVRRIMTEAGEESGGAGGSASTMSRGQSFAAMPSLHFGTSVMAAYVLCDVGPRHGALGWAYALTLGFGLVYLGEHYVCDLLAGFGLAYGVRKLGPAAGHLRRAQLAFQQLEPRAR